jgi:hypothetical protein
MKVAEISLGYLCSRKIGDAVKEINSLDLKWMQLLL